MRLDAIFLFVKALVISNVVASFASSSFAMPTEFYDRLAWKELQSLSLSNGNVNTILADGVSGRFIRVRVPAQCGYISLAVSAEGKPFTPRMVFDQQAQVINPIERRSHWYVAQNSNVVFSHIWVTASNLEIADCRVAVEVASQPNEDANQIEEGTPRKTVKSMARSKYSKAITTEIAMNRAVGRAQELCQSLNVVKVPNQALCESSQSQNIWTTRCSVQFYCLPNLM